MSAAASAQSEPVTAGRPLIFASFLLGSDEFAVPAAQVQEVVNFPERVVPMPLAPDFVRGVFDLRGTVVPMIDMDLLLGRERRRSSEGVKVAIVIQGGARLGLVFDDTLSVLRPASGSVQAFTYPSDSTHGVVCSVIKQAQGLVRVLDLKRLLAIEDVPQQADSALTSSVARAKSQRRRCVTFRSGASRMAFPIADILEILPAIDIGPSPIPERLCAGIMHVRGRVLPVVRFSELIGAGPAAEGVVVSDQRVVVVELDGAQAGLLVDIVESIDLYAQDEVAAVPVLNRHRASMFSGCIQIGDSGQVYLLDPKAVLSRDELARITGNHSALFHVDKTKEAERRRTSNARQPHLWFVAAMDFALPMREVLEIADGVDALIAMPGAADHVVGMLDLRGRLVTVVDPRRLYRLGESADATSQERKILIIERDGQLLGLLVDSVCSIVHVHPSQRMPVPQMMRNSLAPAVRSVIIDLISVDQPEAKPAHLLALATERVMDSMAEHEPATADA